MSEHFDSELWAGGLPDTPPDGHAPPVLHVVPPPEPATPKPVALPELPDEFWASRDRLRIIRQGARAALVGPDMVLLTMMCRASAMVSHQLVFDLGRGRGSLNFFGAGVGPSGLGKTIANNVAQDLLLRPRCLSRGEQADPRKFKDGIGLGTGEGLIEAYMGLVDEETGEIDRKGDPVTERVRRQVRHNAYFFLDEGQGLTKLMERSGATIGGILRSAWSGSSLGQQNADSERTRFIERFTYALGLFIGFQPEVAQLLLGDGATGTPQRFMWMSGYDMTLPDADFDQVEPFALPIETPDWRLITGTITGPQWLAKDLKARRRRMLRCEEFVQQLDSHEVAMRCKTASLLAVLDGRMQVTDEDWELADIMWQVSVGIRDRLGEIGRREARKAAEQKKAATVDATVEAHLKVRDYDAQVERVARRMWRRRTELGPASMRDFRQDTAGSRLPVSPSGADAGGVQGVASGGRQPGLGGDAMRCVGRPFAVGHVGRDVLHVRENPARSRSMHDPRNSAPTWLYIRISISQTSTTRARFRMSDTAMSNNVQHVQHPEGCWTPPERPSHANPTDRLQRRDPHRHMNHSHATSVSGEGSEGSEWNVHSQHSLHSPLSLQRGE